MYSFWKVGSEVLLRNLCWKWDLIILTEEKLVSIDFCFPVGDFIYLFILMTRK